jgi:hypothetical protein
LQLLFRYFRIAFLCFLCDLEASWIYPGVVFPYPKLK